jgi:hypothetical protein
MTRTMVDSTHRPGTPAVLALMLVCTPLLLSCGGGGGSSGSGGSTPPPDSALSITTTALPNGWGGHAYTATLSASGGTAPLSWTLSSGALPAGVALSASSGVISGTPSAPADATPLTFTVKDSYSVAQTKSVNLTLSVSPAAITVAATPAQAGITLTQPLSVSATTNDVAGVTWSSSPAGGSFSSASAQSGSAVTFSATTAGVYTLTATSVTDAAQNGSSTVGVTDLGGVLTYHDDLSRDGLNAQEYALTAANVNTTSFGKLFSCTVNSAIYAQPLWMANLTLGGAQHNVVFVASVGDGLYAFDADASPCLQLWHVSLIDAAHGGVPGDTVTAEVGIWGTPVIDPITNILYVATKSMVAATNMYYERVHAIDITTGNEEPGSPIGVTASYPTTSGTVAFAAGQQQNRAGLALVNGTLYVAFGSNGDVSPWNGWVIGYTYSGTGFTQTAVLNATPNANGGGIWMAGGAPAADNNGNLYLITGNGTFDANSISAPNNDYGDCFLQLHPVSNAASVNVALTISSWFAPSDQMADDADDFDFGSGGTALVLNLPSSGGAPQHLLVGGGKDGTYYLVNGDLMGGYGDSFAQQKWGFGAGLYSTGAFFNNTLYINQAGGALNAFTFDPTTNLFVETAAATTTSPVAGFGWPGTTPSVSVPGSNSANAIVWAIDNTNFCFTPTAPACGPSVLHAYSAGTLTELWNSSLAAANADAAGNAMKFTVPTVANGKVYIGTRGNSATYGVGGATIPGELDVYGLKP